MAAMMRRLFDLLFWLAASLCFGGMFTVGVIVAPAVFDTTRARHIELPGISPPLDPTTQAGGEIFGVILQRFWYVELAALGVILVAILGWMFLARPVRVSTWIIAGFWAIVAGLATFDAAALTPRVWLVREQVRTSAPHHQGEPPDAPWMERTEFDALHKESELVGHLKVYALLGMIAVAAWRGAGVPNRTPNTAGDPGVSKE
jgi:hypothetical protein